MVEGAISLAEYVTVPLLIWHYQDGAEQELRTSTTPAGTFTSKRDESSARAPTNCARQTVPEDTTDVEIDLRVVRACSGALGEAGAGQREQG